MAEREKILTVDDLKALPQKRAIVTMGGSKPLLVRKNFWGNTPFADDIKKSLAECDNDIRRIEQKALPLGFSDRVSSEDPTGPIPRVESGTDKAPVELPVEPIDVPAVEAAPARSSAEIFESEFFAEGTN